MMTTIPRPDLAARPHQLSVERDMAASSAALYEAWTERFDAWFAAPGTVLMRGEVDEAFFFEVHFGGERYPHYGRFLALDPGRYVELTWVTGAGGTKGAETVVSVELMPHGTGTRLRLTHAGFPDEETAKQHADAWPEVLAQLDKRLMGAAH
jgi:uncharacterized protein YndB with AHSA1/START domain